MTPCNNNNASRFYKLYPGYSKAHGQSQILNKLRDKDQKREAKSRTINRPLSERDILTHFEGNDYGIGIVPLDDDNNASFGVIDVDEYQIDNTEISELLYDKKIPAFVLRSKSGGAHITSFFEEPENASDVIEAMKNLAEYLGFEGSEIFPKQSKRNTEKGVGNWINAPYFSGDNTDRYCIYNGQKIGLQEFLDKAEGNKTTIEQLSNHPLLKRKKKDKNKKSPPKKETSSTTNPKNHAGRNNAMISELSRIRALTNYPMEVMRPLGHFMNESQIEYFHEKFGSDGALSGSEMDSILNSVENYQEDTATEDILMLDEAIDIMNQDHNIVLEGGKAAVIRVMYNAGLGRDEVVRSKFEDIKNFHTRPVLVGQKRTGERIIKGIGEAWLKHPEAKRFNQVIFAPNENIEGAYNLWKGWRIKPKKGKCDLFYKHLKDNICQQDEVTYHFILNWLARMIQKPASPAEVAIVLQGGRGTGKGVFVKCLSGIVGQYFVHISNSKHLTGNFNSHLQDALLLFCDEAFWAGNKEGEAVIKTYITEEYIMVEPKGFNPYPAKNHLHIIIASNSDWVVPAGERERRYLVLNVSDKKQQNHKYFGKLMDQMENGGYEALLHDLQVRDISDFNFREVPRTDALVQQQIRSLDSELEWIYSRLQQGRWVDGHETWTERVSKKDLQDSYIQRCKDTGASRRSAETRLGTALNNLFPNLRKGKNFYEFPPLEECQKNFEKYIGATIDWPEEDEAESWDDDPM